MEPEKPKSLIIPLQLVEAIGSYLVQQPYAEVYKIVAELQQLKPSPAPDVPRPDEKDAT